MNKIIAQKRFDEKRVIRVVYKKFNDEILVITLYPGRIDMRKIKYSKDVDILTVELSNKPIEYAEEKGDIIIHFSKDGEPVLLEILNAKEFLLDSTAIVLKESERILIK